jgi:hypothetical protein
MKKFTLILGLLVLNFLAFSQENPCPDIQGYGLTTSVVNGTNCTSTVYAYATGDIQSPKGLRIQVYVGAISPANLVADVCHVVPKSSPSTYYESTQFTAPCTSNITFVLTRYTASNGLCQGGTCGTTITVDGGPLPIKLANFYTKRNNNSVVLNWKTEAESNAKEFIIQRKAGNEWINVATVAASNSLTGATYSYTDANNSKTTSQYRLKMVDLDGKFGNSDIRAVKGTATVSDFSVFPNPSTGNAKVTVSDVSESTDVQVIDNAGRIIKTLPMNKNNTVEVNNLQKGMYMIRIINKETGESLTKKLTVIN